jgi:3-dehydroquinate dehydratase type I
LRKGEIVLCIPIIAKNTEEAVKKMALAEALVDMVEVRLDLMEAFDLPEIVRAAKKPVLVTYRSEREGGKGDANPETQVEHILTAVREGADLVDVELSLPPEWRRKVFEVEGKTEIVISTHINHGTPTSNELERIFRDCTATGAPVVKIVTMAKNWEDNLRVLELIPKAQAQGVKVIAFCMGPKGRISRILSHLMGGYVNFVTLEAGQESAAGQIPAMEMKEILEHFA